jgi:hypothetical protein
MFWLSSQASADLSRCPLALKAHTLGPYCMCEQSIPDTIPAEYWFRPAANRTALGCRNGARGRVRVTVSPLFPLQKQPRRLHHGKQALRGARCSSSFLVSGRRHDSLSQAASATGQPPVSCHTCSDLEDPLARSTSPESTIFSDP